MAQQLASPGALKYEVASLEFTLHFQPLAAGLKILFQLFNPIGDKNIGVMSAPVISVAAEKDLFTIRAKHGERIEAIIPAYLFKPMAADICEIHVERKTSCVFMVTAKNDVISIGSKTGGPIGFTQKGNLVRIASIGIGNKYFH